MAAELSLVASEVASAATYPAGVVGAAGSADADAVSNSAPVLHYADSLAEGAVGAAGGAAGSAVAGVVSNSSSVLHCAGSGVKGTVEVAGGAAAGAVVASTVGTITLNAVGFTAVGPAAGSYAAAWMSSIAAVNGGGVAAGSLYSVLQAMAMGGGMLLGAPALLAAGAVVGAARAFALKARL